MTADPSIFVKGLWHEHGLHMGAPRGVGLVGWSNLGGGGVDLSPCFQHMRSIHTRIPVFSLLCLIQESLARS